MPLGKFLFAPNMKIIHVSSAQIQNLIQQQLECLFAEEYRRRSKLILGGEPVKDGLNALILAASLAAIAISLAVIAAQ